MGGRRVLIVEDEAAIALDLADFLETQFGATVIGPVASIEGALRVIDAGDLDGALLDIQLQDGKADAIAAALRKRSVPFVFVTGYSEAMIPAGFEDRPVLQKPYQQSQLLRLARDIFRL